MPTKKKPFIERHNSTTYRLVYRSHKDPLVIDGESSTHVLSPVGGGRNSRPLLGCAQAKVETSSGVEGTRTKRDSGIGAPGPVFGSRPGGGNDLIVGADKFSTPQVDLNPDTIAAWGGNLDFLETEDLLEDDFVQLANRDHMHDSNVDAQVVCLTGLVENKLWSEDHPPSARDEVRDKIQDATYSVYYGPSFRYNALKRNECALLLDGKFGMDEHCSTESGDQIDSPPPEKCNDPFFEDMNDEEGITRDRAQKYLWDCESILNMNSNTLHRPKLLREGFSRNIRTHATSKGEAEHNQQTPINSSVHVNKRFEKTPEKKSVSEGCLPIRIRGESTEDKKERKTASKNLKKDKTKEKKAKAKTYKDEKIVQDIVVKQQTNLWNHPI